MKKILSIVLLLAMLAGCTPKAEEPAATQLQTEPLVPTEVFTEESTIAPTEAPAPEYEQLPLVSVCLPVTAETEIADNGTEIYRYTSQSIQLIHQDADVAEKVILDFLNRVDRRYSDAEQIHEGALAQYYNGITWNTHFFDQIYNPTRIDHNVLSLYGEVVSYSGGNHPQRICTAANYNMVTGDVLTLGSILYHIDSLSTLEELVLAQLDLIREEKYLLDGYGEVVHQRFQKDESFDEDWYFSEEGLCFYFAPYEIAPYSSGVVIAQIPYSQLTGVIADEFFPVEEDEMIGTLLCSAFAEADMDSFTQISEVILDHDGEKLILFADGAVRDVRIDIITMDEASGYEIANTVFATYTLTPGDAILLQVDTQDSTQKLRISCTSGDEVITYDLTADAELIAAV